MEFEAQSYLSLISAKNPDDFDDRRDSIEFQSCADLALTPEIVELVVLPAIFLNDPVVKSALTDWKAEIRPYPVYRSNPNHNTMMIYREVSEYLEKAKFW